MKVGGKPQIGLLPYENSELVNRVLHILGLGGGGGAQGGKRAPTKSLTDRLPV